MNFSTNSIANALKEYGSQVFLNTLSKIYGAKDLVLTETILVQLDSICGMRKLRQNAVDKVFKLQSDLKISETANRVYVLRPIIEEIYIVSKEINSYLNRDDDCSGDLDIKFWIVFVPSKPYFCEVAIEEEGIYEYVTVLECPLTLIPLETDVYSLENERIFKSLYLNNDITSLNEIIASIIQLQDISGTIPEICGQGRFAKIVADRVARAAITDSNLVKPRCNSRSSDDKGDQSDSDKNSSQDNATPKSSFTHLFLFDRNCDFGSVLLTQCNYEGLIDETFNISCNKFEFEDFKNKDDPILIKHSLTNESDPIYRDFRDNHLTTTFIALKSKNREMKERYNKSMDMNLSNLKNFVTNELKKLQLELKCIALHMSVCEEIMRRGNEYDIGEQLKIEQDLVEGSGTSTCLDYVTKLITHQLNNNVPLRLLSLLSLIQGGLPPKDYNKYRSSYCENFGLVNNKTFDNLSKLGLITEMDLSFSSMIGNSNKQAQNTSSSIQKNKYVNSGITFASLTGAMSSLTEAASEKVAAAVTSAVLPKKGSLNSMIKRFNLVPPIDNNGYNIRDPKDPAFVFGGSYIPLICRLIDGMIIKNKDTSANMKLFSEALKTLPKPNFKFRQTLTSSRGEQSPSILVYFVGGVSYAEITALRFLAKKSGVNIAIGTSSIINGNRLMRFLCPSV